jgi:hypothetical protein
MPEQLLDGADVVAVDQEVGGEAVPQAVEGGVLAMPARPTAALKARWTVRSCT